MIQKILRFSAFAILLLAVGMQLAWAQGTTTATIVGTVSDASGETLPGANVLAVHGPSGTQYGTTTRLNGSFTFPNMRVGGPYTITTTFVGFEDNVIPNIYLSLGQDLYMDIEMSETAVELGIVEITAGRAAVIDGERTGAQTNIGEAQLQTLPTVSRDLTDFTRFTPQSTLTEDGDGELGFSVAGQNNRFNSVFIDGAISNDVFGLSDQGTNGGQAGVSPISIDAIEEFQIVVAPYDVTIGGFTGGGVNAVTRSGSNEIEGSAYWLHKGEKLAGKTPTDNPFDEIDNPDGIMREKLADFASNIYGARIGGPIKKNKAFFFANIELEKRQTPLPAPFSFAGDSIVGYDGDATASELEALEQKLLNDYGYDAGGYLNNEKVVDGFKILAKIDWNISDKHNLTVRHSFSKGESEKVNPSDDNSINFNNSYEFFPSTTNSTAIEFNSLLSNEMSNNLVFGYTRVRDDRDALGGDFPRVGIDDGDGFITFGTEAFSTANNLEQDVFTITNNFKLYKGKHTLTIGTHNEMYKILNLFVRQNYGQYDYNSLSDFMNDGPIDLYQRSYSLLDDAVGDDIVNAAAKFKAMQLGFYVQDEFRVNRKVKLSLGLRMDIPVFLDDPPVDENFNTVTVPLIEEHYDLKGARAGQMPSPQLIFSPRFGFNIDPTGEKKTQIRGGVGLFTSRLPLVWAGGSLANNGLTVGGVFEFSPELISGGDTTAMTFIPDINGQPTATDFGKEDPVPSGQMDLFVEDLKFPQVLKASLAVDQELPWGLLGTVEGLVQKNINSILYFNYNVKPSIGNIVNNGNDDRPIFNRGDEIDDTYDRIILGDNTSEGLSYNITANLSKQFSSGFSASLGYTYGYAEALNDLTSSQNSSQWRNHEVVGDKNNLVVSQSDFSMGSRVTGTLSYRKEYANHAATTISLYYNGQSGEVFSYTYTGRNADRLTSQDSRDFTDLLYVPASASEINLAGDAAEQAAQWAELDAYISQDDYLSSRRGQYAERNGSRTPFTNILDLRLLQDFFIESGGKRHNLQISLDIFNFTNLLNKNWGRRYRSFFNGVGLIDVEGVSDEVQADGTVLRTPTFSYSARGENTTLERLTIDDTGALSSRWQGQIGVRYSF